MLEPVSAQAVMCASLLGTRPEDPGRMITEAEVDTINVGLHHPDMSRQRDWRRSGSLTQVLRWKTTSC